jgi:4,5-dihydroxyphthalate decarboxylase
MTEPKPLRLRALLGDYPATHALRTGALSSPLVAFDFADVKLPQTAFKRTVRELEFDASELAIVTYLLAKAHGKPLVLLPAVVTARFQHPYLVCRADRPLGPGDLNGKRIAIRSHSVTTVAWLRGMLMADHGLDVGSVRWVTFEDPHVAEFKDPPNAERAGPGKDPFGMLIAGEVDAAVLGEPSTDPRVRTVYPDAAAAAQEWFRRHGTIQLNHMVTVKASLSQSEPDAVREVWRLLVESKKAAGLPAPGTVDINPLGIEAVRRGLDIAIDYVHRQGLIPRRFAVEELFDDVTRNLKP